MLHPVEVVFALILVPIHIAVLLDLTPFVPHKMIANPVNVELDSVKIQIHFAVENPVQQYAQMTKILAMLSDLVVTDCARALLHTAACYLHLQFVFLARKFAFLKEKQQNHFQQRQKQMQHVRPQQHTR